MASCVSVNFHALEAFEAVMEDAGCGVKADVLIGNDPRLMPPAYLTPFDLKHMICIRVRRGCVPSQGRIRLSAFSSPVTYFPKARSWAGGIAEDCFVLVTRRQEASSLAGVEGCEVTAAKGGDDNSIPGAMLRQIAVVCVPLGQGGGHIHHISWFRSIPTGLHLGR